jgi:hypothetical protein
MFIFLVYHRSGPVRSCSTSKDLSAYKISQSHVVLHPPQEFANLTIAIFKSSIKGNIKSNKSCRSVHDLSLYQTLFVLMQQLNLNCPTCSYFFFVFHKSGFIKNCSSSEDLSAYKISCSHLSRWKFCIHLRSPNVCHFGTVEATRLQAVASRSLSMAWPSY